MNERGTLVIGLGEAGLRVKQQMAARWERLQTYAPANTLFSTVGAGLMPDADPDYLQLDGNVARARQLFGSPLPPYIRSWADPAALAVKPSAGLTRAQARLLWFAHLAQGSSDPLVALWTRQLRLLAHAKSVAIFLIADLNETFASATVADAVYLTRALAAQEHLEVTLWAFTILPAPDAPHAVRLGGYAALRELSRLTNASDSELGYPFIYRTGSGEAITQGWLRKKPFDLWYCFEGEQAEAELSGIVDAFLYEQSFSEAATFAANLSVNTRQPDPLGVYISTGNARTLALPVKEYAAYAVAQNRRDALAWLLTPPEPTQVKTVLEGFLNTNPSLRSSRMVTALQDLENHLAPRTQESRLDEWLLNNQALAAEAFTADSRQLRDPGQLLEAASHETLVALRRLVERVGKPPAARGAPLPSAYDNLVTAAAERHSREFEAYVIRALAEWLAGSHDDGSPFAQTRAVIGALGAELKALETVLGQLFQRCPALETQAQQQYSAFDSAARKLEGLYRDFSNRFQRLQHAGELRAAQTTVLAETTAYLTTRRLLALIAAAHKVITAQAAAAAQADQQLARWAAAFQAGLAAAQVVNAELPVEPTVEWAVTSLDDNWLAEQGRMAVSRNRHTPWIEQIHWRVDAAQIALVTPEAVVQPGDLTPLWVVLDRIYTDFHRSTTLLRYLRETTPARWLPFLAEAQQMSLQLYPSVNSTAQRRARLYAPETDQADERLLPEMLVSDLNRAQRLAATSRSLIDLKTHQETDRLMYVCLTDNIELQSEAVTLATLADYAAKHGAALEAFQVLSADREAARLGRVLGRPLLPAAATLMHDIDRLRWFWIAYALNLLGEEPTTNGRLSIVFTLPERRALLLTRPLLTQAQAWLAAIAAFVGAYEMPEGGLDYQPIHEVGLADTATLGALISDVWDGAASSLPVDQCVQDYAPRIAWLERARDVVTPVTVRQQIEQGIVRHALLDRFIEDLGRGHSAFIQNQEDKALVLVDLYEVGAALLKEQQRLIEDQILGWIAHLPGGTLTAH